MSSPPRAGLARRLFIDHPVAVIVAVGLFLFTTNFFAGHKGISGWDALYYFSYSAALADSGSLDLEPAYHALVNQGANAERFDPGKRTATGQVYNYFPIGHSLLQVPAVFVGNRVGLLTDGKLNAYGVTAQFFFCLSCILWAAVGAGLVHREVAAMTSPEGASIALYILCGGSMLGYYWFLIPALSHTSSILAVGLVLALFLRVLRNPDPGVIGYLALGAATGLGVIIRLQDIGLGVFPLWMLVVLLRSDVGAGGKLARAAALVLGGLAVVAIQMLHWHWKDGAWIMTQYSDYATFDITRPHLVEVLFSPRHGLFLWHPLLLAGFVGLVMWLRAGEARPAGWCLLVFFAAIWLIGACFSIWWFGDSFGSRPFLSVLPLFWIGLAHLWDRAKVSGRWRTVYVATAVLLIAWNGLLALSFHLGWISRSGPLDPQAILERLTGS